MSDQYRQDFADKPTRGQKTSRRRAKRGSRQVRSVTQASAQGTPLWQQAAVVVVVAIMCSGIVLLLQHRAKPAAHKTQHSVHKKARKSVVADIPEAQYEFYRVLTKPRVAENFDEAPVVTAKAAAKQVAPSYQYAVQVASFKSRPDAQRMVKKLAKRGYGAKILQRDHWYRVVLGPFDDQDWADDVVNALRKIGMNGLVRRMPKI